ncbi:nuclear transport factor 2 family protein [Mycobacterium antarcticum]|uniref:nuclear transport factor 2 family protein n=1 Tax=Mycolicibacterium sp. TUM20985 TaxID=3023370 RepID=UPI0025727A62|nr:nuclear transport factor 2 family protein [Mycolicibacterium sp. TUM20985]
MSTREPSTATVIAERLYTAFSAGDGVALAHLLHPTFVGRVSAGMPFGVGGDVEGPLTMLNEVWAATFTHYDAAPQPDEFLAVGDERVVVFGYYRGRSRTAGRPYEAAFAHDITIQDGRIASLIQITDTKCWHDALG